MMAYIPSESMLPSMEIGDIFFATRYDANKDVQRYDVMIFPSPNEPNKLYVKRVIGLPGETITVEDGHVYADGEELRSDFLFEEMDSNGDGVYKVPENGYFMMGDNRNHSFDSRFWDDPYITKFTAKVRFQVFPLNKIGKNVNN